MKKRMHANLMATWSLPHRLRLFLVASCLIAGAFWLGRFTEASGRWRIVADKAPNSGDRLFGVDPFFDRLSQFVVYHEDRNFLVQLSRSTNSERFKVVFISAQDAEFCDVSSKQVETISNVMDLHIQHFVGFRLDDNGRGLPIDQLPRFGFGTTEFSTPPGYILYKHFNSEEQTVSLGNSVSNNAVNSYYILQYGGAISIVDLHPLLEAVRRLCSK